MLASRSRRLLLLTAACLALVSAGAISNGTSIRPQQTRSDNFWRLLSVSTLEVEHYDSLDAMTSGSEAVVLGKIVGVSLSRTFGGPEDAELIHLAALEVSASRVLAGRLTSTAMTIVVEVTVPGGRNIEDLQATIPTEEAIYFLRNKGTEASDLGFSPEEIEAEAPYYRLVSSQGLIRNLEGAALPPEAAEDPFLVDIRGARFSEVTSKVLGAVVPSQP